MFLLIRTAGLPDKILLAVLLFKVIYDIKISINISPVIDATPYINGIELDEADMNPFDLVNVWQVVDLVEKYAGGENNEENKKEDSISFEFKKMSAFLK